MAIGSVRLYAPAQGSAQTWAVSLGFGDPMGVLPGPASCSLLCRLLSPCESTDSALGNQIHPCDPTVSGWSMPLRLV